MGAATSTNDVVLLYHCGRMSMTGGGPSPRRYDPCEDKISKEGEGVR